MKAVIATCFESNEERASSVYEVLKKLAYEVRIFSSDYSHIRKEKRKSHPENVTLIEARPYSRNLSLQRIVSHSRFAKDLFARIEEEKADLIWLMAPANSLIAEAKRYKKDHPETRLVIDIIDIRYWHYNTKGLWAAQEGKNMAPRQWIRKYPLGSVGFNEVYKAVREYRDRYPEKAVIYYSPSYNTAGWAVLMAGGSLPNLRIQNAALAEALPMMAPAEGNDCLVLGNADKGYLVYARGSHPAVDVANGQYRLYEVSQRSGEVKMVNKALKGNGSLSIPNAKENAVYWLEKR